MEKTTSMRALLTVLGLLCTAAATHAQEAPWLIVDAQARSDNQPRTGVRSYFEYGRYLSPALTGSVTFAAEYLTGDGAGATTAFEPGVRGSLGISSLRAGLRAGASALIADDRTVPLGFADVSVGLGAGSALRARLQRDRYTATLASLHTVVLERRAELSLDRAGAPGWAGELLARRTDYGDDNPVATLYGWVLAPLTRSAAHGVRAGYSVSWQDAAESRWTPDAVRRGRGRGGVVSVDSISGRYDPYYTPHDALTHSVLAEAAVLVGRTWLRANGAYGVHATELAPRLEPSAGIPAAPPVLTFFERRYSPYAARLLAFAPVSDVMSLTLMVEHARTAFFRENVLRINVARSFGGR